MWGGGLDITDLVLMTASDLALAPGGETILFAVKFPVMLPRARYTIKVSGATATGQFSHSASFTVQ